MTRNAERDKLEAERRKDQLIEVGFELFARYGIESVSLSAVAKKADVAASTMYKHFQNKASLAVAISGRIWSDVWTTARERQGADTLAQMNPYQLFEVYATTIIGLYLERPQVLRYSANYKTYIRRENVPEGMLGEHLDPLRPIAELFLSSCKVAATGTPRAHRRKPREDVLVSGPHHAYHGRALRPRPRVDRSPRRRTRRRPRAAQKLTAHLDERRIAMCNACNVPTWADASF